MKETDKPLKYIYPCVVCGVTVHRAHKSANPTCTKCRVAKAAKARSDSVRHVVGVQSTIHMDTLEQLEAAAERLKISRSKMIRFAIERLLEAGSPPLDQAPQ